MFTDQKPIDEESGRALAAWARGGSAAPLRQPDGAADDKTAAEWDVDLGEAAKKGIKELQECWAKIPRALQPDLKAALDRRHKPTAAQADARTPA